MKPILKRKSQFTSSGKLTVIFFLIIGLMCYLVMHKYQAEEQILAQDLRLDEELFPPECPNRSGGHESDLTVVLQSQDPDFKIYYTLDGSPPALNSFLYEAPFVIKDRTNEAEVYSFIPSSPRWMPPLGDVHKGTVLRAIAVDSRYRKSRELIRTFFPGEKKGSSDLPVVAITVDPKDMFGYKEGIYVMGKSYEDKDNYIRKNIPLDLPWWLYPSNYQNRGKDEERKCYIEFFEPGKKKGFEAFAGLRIHGNATRGYGQKSLRVSFDASAQLSYDLFEKNVNDLHHAFILRNSGNDWDKTMFRDGFMQSLMKNSSLDIQRYKPVIVYIDAEYWGIHNLMDRLDEDYLANKYRVDKEHIVILQSDGDVFYGKKSDRKDFDELLHFIKNNDLGIQKNYDHVTRLLDIENFADLIIANVFFCNSDWPNNNVRFWKYDRFGSDTLKPMDGRWRWMLNDTDWGFGYNDQSTPENDLLEKARTTGSVGIIFNGLLKNKVFSEFFTDRFNNFLNSTFKTDRMIGKIDSIAGLIDPEIPRHIRRWRSIRSYEDWLKNVEVLRDFARKRPAIQTEQLRVFMKQAAGEE